MGGSQAQAGPGLASKRLDSPADCTAERRVPVPQAGEEDKPSPLWRPNMLSSFRVV
jgi:hypothetical protein